MTDPRTPWPIFLKEHAGKSIPEQFDLFQKLWGTAATWGDLGVSDRSRWLDNYATAPTSAAVH